jgi:hypothetical protein
MKKFLWLFIMLLTITVTSYAQDETVQIKKTDLTTEQLAKLQVEETKQKIVSYGEIAGFGKEIGIAINDGLNAVVDVSQKFAGTDVGKFTIAIIGWKLLYKDFIQILLGLLFVVFVNILIFKYHKTLRPHKVLKKGAWYQFWVTKEYDYVEPDEFEGIEAIKILLIAISMGSFGFTYLIMFG